MVSLIACMVLLTLSAAHVDKIRKIPALHDLSSMSILRGTVRSMLSRAGRNPNFFPIGTTKNATTANIKTMGGNVIVPPCPEEAADGTACGNNPFLDERFIESAAPTPLRALSAVEATPPHVIPQTAVAITKAIRLVPSRINAKAVAAKARRLART